MVLKILNRENFKGETNKRNVCLNKYIWKNSQTVCDYNCFGSLGIWKYFLSLMSHFNLNIVFTKLILIAFETHKL